MSALPWSTFALELFHLIEIIAPGLCCSKLINVRVFNLDFKTQYLEQSEDKNIYFADQLNQ